MSESAESTRYAVPAEKAGLVIGKGGESIKEICRVSGAHVEISKEPPPDQSIKIFNVRGNPSEIETAIRWFPLLSKISSYSGLYFPTYIFNRIAIW